MIACVYHELIEYKWYGYLQTVTIDNIKIAKMVLLKVLWDYFVFSYELQE